ncbi:unnamed protein product, partial [Rotaria sp. Silwood2]
MGEKVVPLVHHMLQVDSIFVLRRSESHHQQWNMKWLKVKGVFNEAKLICDALKEVVQQCDHDLTPMSFMPLSAMSTIAQQNLGQLEPSFMYTQLFKEIILEIDEDDE